MNTQTDSRLPGLDPGLPPRTRDRALLLLHWTRRVITLRGQIREAEHEIARLTAALSAKD